MRIEPQARTGACRVGFGTSLLPRLSQLCHPHQAGAKWTATVLGGWVDDRRGVAAVRAPWMTNHAGTQHAAGAWRCGCCDTLSRWSATARWAPLHEAVVARTTQTPSYHCLLGHATWLPNGLDCGSFRAACPREVNSKEVYLLKDSAAPNQPDRRVVDPMSHGRLEGETQSSTTVCKRSAGVSMEGG